MFVCTLLALTAVSCKPPAEEAVSAPTAPTAYSVTGIVTKLDGRVVTIRHQEIPGYMEAMTMPFEVKDTNELTGLIPGEEVTFKMLVTEDDAWIENVEKTGFATNLLPKVGEWSFARDVEPLDVGDSLPDSTFTNELGEVVRFSQFKDRVIVLSFLFTRCPFPKFCPLTARKLAETQDALLARAGGPRNWRILVVTIDPAYDTPERLRQFGRTYGYKPEWWSFLTASLTDITAVGEQFGLRVWTEQGLPSHNLRTVVIGPDGIIRTNIIGNEWEVEALVAEVVKAADDTPDESRD